MIFKDYLQNLQWRAAVKNFDPQKTIPKEVMDRLLEGVRLTPTSFGLQAGKILIIKNLELRKLLKSATFHQNQVMDCSHYVVFCARTTVDEDYVTEYVRKFAQLRTLTIKDAESFVHYILGHIKKMTPQELENWLGKQTYISLGNMITLCALEGVDTCPIEGFVPTEYDEILKLRSQGFRSTVCLALGYRSAKEKEVKKVRRKTEEIFDFID